MVPASSSSRLDNVGTLTGMSGWKEKIFNLKKLFDIFNNLIL